MTASVPVVSDRTLFQTAQLFVERAFRLMREEGRESGNTGGRLYVLHTDPVFNPGMHPALAESLGSFPGGNDTPYCLFAREKARRLLFHTADASSFQSRDPAQEQFAGAIRAGSWILSFSGLPELVDEAVVLNTAVAALLLVPEEAERIAALSQNEYYAKLRDRAA